MKKILQFTAVILMILFLGCADGNIRTYLTLMRDYMDGTNSVKNFTITPGFNSFTVQGDLSAGISYHYIIKDQNGATLVNTTITGALNISYNSGTPVLVPVNFQSYIISIAPINAALGQDGRVDENSVMPGVIFCDPSFTGASGSGCSFATPVKDLQTALNLANAMYTSSDPRQVRLPLGEFFPASAVALPANVSLKGGYSKTTGQLVGKTTLSGNNSHQVFTSSTTNTVIENLIIRDGYGAVNGGGLYISLGSLTIKNCNFIDNVAVSDGGAIYLFAGSLFLEKCNFTNNSANYGGAITVQSGSLDIDKSLFIRNSVVGGYGGAIHLGSAAQGLYATNSVFYLNETTNAGGRAISCYDGSMAVRMAFCSFYSSANSGYSTIFGSPSAFRGMLIVGCVFHVQAGASISDASLVSSGTAFSCLFNNPVSTTIPTLYARTDCQSVASGLFRSYSPDPQGADGDCLELNPAAYGTAIDIVTQQSYTQNSLTIDLTVSSRFDTDITGRFRWVADDGTATNKAEPGAYEYYAN